MGILTQLKPQEDITGDQEFLEDTGRDNSTIGKHDQGIIEAISLAREIFIRNFPDNEEYQRLLDAFLFTRSSGFFPTNIEQHPTGLVYTASMQEKHIIESPFLQALYHANPKLCVPEYYGMLFTRSRITAGDEGKHPWFNSRFRAICDGAGITPDHPIAQILAVTYITQIAKERTTYRVDRLLTTLRPVQVIKYPDKFAKSLQDRLWEIRHGQAFIAQGLQTVRNIAEESGIPYKHVLLLRDLAFLRNRTGSAAEQRKTAKELFAPIYRYIGQGKWDEAMKLRDFLLAYYSSLFPKWRTLQNPDTSYTSFIQLHKAIREKRIPFDRANIPDAYKYLFVDFFGIHLSDAEDTPSALYEVRAQTLFLTQEFIASLAYKTRIVQWEKEMERAFAVDAKQAQHVIMQAASGEREGLLAAIAFFQRYKQASTVEEKRAIGNMIRRHVHAYQSIQRTTIPPFILRVPQHTPIVGISFGDNNEHTIAILNQRETRVSISFGSLLGLLLQQEKSKDLQGNTVLSSQHIADALYEALRYFQKRNNMDDITAVQYLEAITENTTDYREALASFIALFPNA